MGEEVKLPKKLRSMKNELDIAVRKKDARVREKFASETYAHYEEQP